MCVCVCVCVCISIITESSITCTYLTQWMTWPKGCNYRGNQSHSEKKQGEKLEKEDKLLLREASLFLKPIWGKGREEGNLRSVGWINLKL